MPIDTAKYKEMFIREAEDNIVALNNALLKLEKKPDDKVAATNLMMAAHTLKSSSAAMGFTNMSQLAHAVEDIFDGVRSGETKFSPAQSNTIFAAFDHIEKSLEFIKGGNGEQDASVIIQNLHGVDSEQLDHKSDQKTVSRSEAIRVLEEIKVDTKILDSLMNLSEELLVNKMRLSDLATKQQYDELPAALDVLDRLVSDIQYNTMQARMVPLGEVFNRFPRMVRDLANQENKQVDFKITGGDIELDRTVIDKIGEPLVHLLRNAVDHGIGENGAVRIHAARERGHVLIEVINDGNTINWKDIIEKAAAKKIISNEQRDVYQKDIISKSSQLKFEIEDLIYHPELSTSESITQTSGRGIGLNIVRERIESLGGSVTLESPILGRTDGTKFTLRIPLTIAIIQALLVRVENSTYAVPISNIERSVLVKNKFVKRAFDRDVAIVADVDIPLIYLNELFRLKPVDKSLQLKSDDILVTIIKQEDEKKPAFGLVIDELVSEQEIVIKPLTGILKRVKGFAGVTILGDGLPALILDVKTLT